MTYREVLKWQKAVLDTSFQFDADVNKNQKLILKRLWIYNNDLS